MKKKRTLSASVTVVCVVFIVLLSVLLSALTYMLYTRSMYHMYQKQMESIVSYVESYIDNDDMSECARTYEESEKYKEARIFFDQFIDHYTDIHYLYILKALEPDDPVKVRSVLSANSTYEKENEPENLIYLGDGNESWYSEETAAQLRAIQNGSEDVYFVEKTEWGTDYTLARPLINSAGEHYGLLCVDVSIDDIFRTINRNIYISIALIAALGILFVAFLVLWLRRNVTVPIRKLENSVAAFARESTGKRDPEDLVFTPPDIHTGNEVESLTEAVTKLSVDMKEYVKGIVAAEDEARDLQSHVTEMNTIAYQDALTLVKNKAAYEKMTESLNWDIMNRSAEFAIVMADLNFLKVINDRYGHDKGDEYIKGSCRIICDVYQHSPVFRIGGDEFVVVLEGEDYRNKDSLLEKLKKTFGDAMARSELEPWNRYSAAVGMAWFLPGTDPSVDAVFRRADAEMYKTKMKMKGEAKSAEESIRDAMPAPSDQVVS